MTAWPGSWACKCFENACGAQVLAMGKQGKAKRAKPGRMKKINFQAVAVSEAEAGAPRATGASSMHTIRKLLLEAWCLD